jgi:hypothetical protein
MTRQSGALKKQKRALQKATMDELAHLFGRWVPLEKHLDAERRRLFSPERTFWLFLSQVLSADGSCQEAVRKFLAWRALEGEKPASSRTGAYCKARQRLSKGSLADTHRDMVQGLKALEGEEARWCGRTVKVVDGSAVSMPDTPENQARYPQPGTQKPGCGFPVMRIVALFTLSGGFLLDAARGALRVHERTLAHQLWEHLNEDDVLLADRGFCSYGDCYLLRQRGVDCVMRNHQRRTTGIRQIKRIGKGDRLIQWLKSKPCPKGWNKDDWAAVPDTLLVREITINAGVPGFRTRNIVIATTLLDPALFPKEAFAELYRRRWRVELFLRDIKITMGMDILRCKTPDMVEKELYMHFIAYNLIRRLMCNAAREHHLPPDRLSFKGTVATVRQWAPIMAAVTNHEKQQAMTAALLNAIARDPVPLRPNRTEPRALKRRPKNYQRLTKPRKEFIECQHRNKYKKA